MRKCTYLLCGFLGCLLFITAAHSLPARAENSFDALVNTLKNAKHQKSTPEQPAIAQPEQSLENIAQPENPLEQGSSTPPEGLALEPAAPEKMLEKNEFADIPDAYLIEADAFEKECNQNSVMSEYYNCQCMALAYLDDRIENGPEKSKSAITMSINTQCQDLTKAAGAAYSTCLLSGAPGLPAGISSAEEYCSCYSSTYARLFKTSRAQPSSTAFTNLKTRAAVQCRMGAEGQTYRVPVSGN